MGEDADSESSLMVTLKSKWHFALLAAFLYIAAPVVNASYYWIEEGRGAYSPNADTIAIPIYSFAMGVLLFSPVYALLVWLATRSYQGGLSLVAFNPQRPIWSGFWSLLLGGLVLADLYDAVGKVIRLLVVDATSDLIWTYLLLCLRSSLVSARVNKAIETMS